MKFITGAWWEDSSAQDAVYDMTEHTSYRDALSHACDMAFGDAGYVEWTDDGFPHWAAVYRDSITVTAEPVPR